MTEVRLPPARHSTNTPRCSSNIFKPMRKSNTPPASSALPRNLPPAYGERVYARCHGHHQESLEAEIEPLRAGGKEGDAGRVSEEDGRGRSLSRSAFFKLLFALYAVREHLYAQEGEQRERLSNGPPR